MMKAIKRLLKWGRVTLAGDDSDFMPVQQVEYMDKTADCTMIFPYGMHANADEDAIVLMFAMYGDPANRAGIPGTPHKRPKMAAGEVCFYHPESQSIIHFKANGDIDIDVDKKASGSININAGVAVNITAPDTIVNGNLTVTGNTALGATVTSNGKDISDTHTHTGSPTAPAGVVSPTGTPV